MAKDEWGREGRFVSLEEYKRRKGGNGNGAAGGIKPWIVTPSNVKVGPREWLLGNIFCREFVSSLIGAGGVGKTALRYAQYVSGAIGKPLTGEFVFKRFRTLIISLEDGEKELKRRLDAVLVHHGINEDQLGDWLYAVSLTRSQGQLMVHDEYGQAIAGDLGTVISDLVAVHKIDLVAIDPLVKSHGLDENSNAEMDQVVSVLSDLAQSLNIAVDVPDHIAKAARSADGEITGGRGASAKVDAMRLVYSLKGMSKEEAGKLGVDDASRVHLVRTDPTKVNIAPPAETAVWYQLVSVSLGNGTEDYPNGDQVQTVVPWQPKALFEELSVPIINAILDDIDKGHKFGFRYSDNNAATTRAAYRVIQEHAPDIEDGRARMIIAAWIKSGLLVSSVVSDAQGQRKGALGLYVDNAKRPGSVL